MEEPLVHRIYPILFFFFNLCPCVPLVYACKNISISDIFALWSFIKHKPTPTYNSLCWQVVTSQFNIKSYHIEDNGTLHKLNSFDKRSTQKNMKIDASYSHPTACIRSCFSPFSLEKWEVPLRIREFEENDGRSGHGSAGGGDARGGKAADVAEAARSSS